MCTRIFVERVLKSYIRITKNATCTVHVNEKAKPTFCSPTLQNESIASVGGFKQRTESHLGILSPLEIHTEESCAVLRTSSQIRDCVFQEPKAERLGNTICAGDDER